MWVAAAPVPVLSLHVSQQELDKSCVENPALTSSSALVYPR